MFGETVDTAILRLITHDRNRKTEEQILAEADKKIQEYVAKPGALENFVSRCGEHFGDWKGKTILDVGCGDGDLVNLLAQQGAAEVWGVDFMDIRVKVAESAARRMNLDNVRYVECDFLEFETEQRFDYVISYESLDHIPDTGAALKKMAELVKPGGTVINFAAGFWYGPSTDHWTGYMRFFVPWAHLLFNQTALFEVRREKFRPTDPATRFEDIRGGLNRYTFTDYHQAVKNSGLNIVTFEPNHQFKYRLKFLNPISQLLTKLPLLKHFFTYSAFAVLKK